MTRQLTPPQQELLEARLNDYLHWERFEIAESLGIPTDRDWTDEEVERIIAECNRRHRPFLLSLIEDDPQE